MTAEAITRDTTEIQVHGISGTQPIPEPKKIEVQRYKCHTCFTILKESDLTDDNKCPECGEIHLEKMCWLDHCDCTHTTPMAKIAYCSECGQPICPECGCHDVIQVSRVTGYLANVESFNNGKKQELKDRHRYDII